MEEIKAFLTAIYLWCTEKYHSRKYYGRSRPGHLGNSKRNTQFYVKLEQAVLPLLADNNYRKKGKRIFVKTEDNALFFVHFALNQARNGLCVDYGEIAHDGPIADDATIVRKIKQTTSFQRLKPDFWAYDYQYPVRRTGKYDEGIIGEIVSLLRAKL